MKRKNLHKNLIIILICVFVPMLVAVGVASWYMISESHIKPKYNPDSAFYIYLNNQSTTYNGAAQLPKSTNDNVSFDKDTISFICYKKNSEGKFVEYEHDAPIDAGDYLLRYSDSEDETDGGYPSSDVLFKINKADLELESISVNYTQFADKNYFSTEMNTSDITYASSFKFYNEGSKQYEYIDGSAKYSHSESLSIGESSYNYTFYPDDSNNFNTYVGSLNITTYAKVLYKDDSFNEYKTINTVYVPENSMLEEYIPDKSNTSNGNQKESFINWLHNGESWTNTTITNNIELVANWNYIQYTITLNDVTLNSNNELSYLPDNNYIYQYDIRDLPIEYSIPTSDIKYFHQWKCSDGSSVKTDLKISNTGNYIYNAIWYDIIKIENLIYDYSTTNSLSFSDVSADLFDEQNISLLDPNSNFDISKISFTLHVMHNGYYYYGDKSKITDEYADTATKTANKIAGSTYLAYFTPEYSGGNLSATYVIYNQYTNEFIYNKNQCSAIITYKTAIYNSVNCTVEKAIYDANTAGGGTITLNGNSTNASSYIETCFTGIFFGDRLGEEYSNANAYLSSDKINYILNSIQFIVPFNSSNDIKVEGTGSSTNVYSALTIPDNIVINLENNTSLIASAQINYSSIGTKTYIHGVIMNDGLINVKNGCSIYAYGFIKSSSFDKGYIDLQSGSTGVDCLTIYDWPGGTAASAIIRDIFPINSWSCHNISCKTRISYDAAYKAYVYVTTSVMNIKAESTIVTNDDSKGSLFIGSSGFIIKTTEPSQTSPSNNIYTITGDNQTVGSKDTLLISGSYKDSTFELDAGMATVSTSTSKACPLSFLSVIIDDGAQITLSKADYMFFPGTFLEVKKGGKLIVQSNVDVSFIDNDIVTNDSIKEGNRSFTKYYKDNVDSYLKIGGNVTISSGGNIGGLVVASDAEAKISFANQTKSKYKSLYSTSSPYYYSLNDFYAYGNIHNSTQAFSSGTYTAAQNESNSFYWVGTQTNKTSDFYSLSVSSGGSCITGDTLVTLADGTKKMVKDLLPTDLLLVFNHETGKYESAPIIFNDVEPEDIYRIVNLKFSDGTIVKVVYEHGFFDTILNKYVYIREDNMNEFIGHKFYQGNYDGTIYTSNEVTLVDAYVTEELTTVYSPVTVYHLNYFTEDMLSMPAGIPGLFNIFEYGDNLTFDKEQMEADIDKYGLYTYDDFKDYISYEVYSMFPAPYLKVAVGKGLTTYEEIIEMIYLYLEKHDLMK